MKLQNAYNRGRKVYLFVREDNGELTVKQDDSLNPYYYEENSSGKFKTYDNKLAQRIEVSEPRDINEMRSGNSYEADVQFHKRYIVDRIPYFTKSNTRYVFFDIETISKDLPDPMVAKDPVSCITCYDSLRKTYKTFFIGDYLGKDIKEIEKQLLDNFVEYLREIKPDLLLAWNISFDFPYLSNRIAKFANKISPINEARRGDINSILYPAGISVVDYMTMFKKVKMREQSYALDRIAQKYLKEESWGNTKFDEVSDRVKAKNINDVKRLVKLEERFKILPYYDEIRIKATCLWEDLLFNSKVLDVMILREAKEKKIVLPNKKQMNENEEDLQGAYRRSDIGVFHNVYKADVASMYPSQMISFCLDAQNITGNPDSNCVEINGTWFKQDKSAIIPSMAIKLVGQKDKIKAQLKTMSDKDAEYENTKAKYDAIKALVNSLYGVTALSSFRLFNFKVASAITFLSRDVILYTEEKMKERGYQIIYADTDALMYKADLDAIDQLNALVTDWAIDKYGKDDVQIVFDAEGKFSKILILGKCHYFGLITKKGKEKEEEEIKGMEMKRSSSSAFEVEFQKELVLKILNEVPKTKIVEWVKEETTRFRSQPLLRISFPAKLTNKDYKVVTVQQRAIENSKLLNKSFSVDRGELFRYIYVRENKEGSYGKPMDVIALTEEFEPSVNVDWRTMEERSIIGKTDALFTAIGWGGYDGSNQLSLF